MSCLHYLNNSIFVAPFVGAWIEIKLRWPGVEALNVAPFVGAWIEISGNRYCRCAYASLPSWERGLKLLYNICVFTLYCVAPFVGAWIEIRIYVARIP